jgi:hypothetical protein
LIDSVHNLIINSYNRCLITGARVTPAFRSYMPNKYRLFMQAVESGFADELVKYYLGKEPDMLEYMIRSLCGDDPEMSVDYSCFDIYPFPAISDKEEYSMKNLSYKTIRSATSNIPSIEIMQQYLREGILQEKLNEDNNLVSRIIILLTILLIILIVLFCTSMACSHQ